MILLIRTDKPEAEIILAKNDIVDDCKWEAHRILSDTLLQKINDLLKKNNVELHDLTGIGVFKGPGSFTGLRIGITVANTLADSLDLPIAGVSGKNWAKDAIKELKDHPQRQIITPKYGAEANITKPRK